MSNEIFDQVPADSAGTREIGFAVPDIYNASRVLFDNHTNYRRSPTTIRILRPLLGRGLFLSEGDDWRHQRTPLPRPSRRVRSPCWPATLSMPRRTR